MKTRFIADDGTDKPIISIAMGSAAHQHPSGLRMNETQARARHRRNAEAHAQRRQSATAAGASPMAKALADSLSDCAYRLMSERPGWSFTLAMKEAIRQRPATARAYGQSVREQAEARTEHAGSGTPMNFHCAACGERLTHHGLSDDRKQATCHACGQVHDLSETETAALSADMGGRIGGNYAGSLDEAGGDADALEDVPPVSAREIPSRNSDGSPVALREIQQRTRRESRRRANSSRPVL